MRLTDISVRALNPPEKGQRTYFDDSFPNFGCRVSQGGTKSFVVQYGPNRNLITLGRYPVLSLKQARKIAHERLAEITLGRHRPKSIAWDDAVTEYLDDCKQQNRPRTVAGYRRLLDRHFPFGRMRLADITYDDLNRKIARLADTPGEQNHALVAVKIFFGWAIRPPRRYVHQDPCQGMVRSPRPARERVLTDPELAAVFATALDGDDAFSPIVALLILSGQRRTEIGSLQRSSIDAQNRHHHAARRNHQERTRTHLSLWSLRGVGVAAHSAARRQRLSVSGAPRARARTADDTFQRVGESKTGVRCARARAVRGRALISCMICAAQLRRARRGLAWRRTSSKNCLTTASARSSIGPMAW